MTVILIVDDQPVNQRVLSLTLRKTGYEVLTAANGQEALTCLAEETVDLAVVDIAMPVMDGITLLRHLRADPKYQQLPVIMLTSSSLDEDRVAAQNEGADEFLSKPISSWDLLETIRRFLT